MANRSWDYRRHKRYVKGIKRIRQDRAEHGAPFFVDSKGEAQLSCDCFCPDATHGKGAVFARFADNPVDCSNSWCCGFDTKAWEKDHPNKIPLGLEEDEEHGYNFG